MPGTTSNAIPASTSASASSPPRPKTNGSPPFSRTTVSCSRPSSTSRALIASCVIACSPGRLPAYTRCVRAGRERDDARVGQPVVDERVRSAADQLTPADGEKAGIAGTRADQVDGHGATHPRRRRVSPSCQAYAATGTRAAAADALRELALGLDGLTRRAVVELRHARLLAPAHLHRDRALARLGDEHLRVEQEPDLRASGRAAAGPPRRARSRRPRRLSSFPQPGVDVPPQRHDLRGRAAARAAAPAGAPTTCPRGRRRGSRPARRTGRSTASRGSARSSIAPMHEPLRHVPGQVLGAVHRRVDHALGERPLDVAREHSAAVADLVEATRPGRGRRRSTSARSRPRPARRQRAAPAPPRARFAAFPAGSFRRCRMRQAEQLGHSLRVLAPTGRRRQAASAAPWAGAGACSACRA